MVRAVVAALCAFLLFPAVAGAAFPQDGKRWRQVADTTGVTAAQVAAVCPSDGESRCSGVAGGRDLTGWIWATDAQVIALMGHYEPSILTADPPSVSGVPVMFTAMNFITDMRATFSFSGYPTTIAFVSGWTASGNVAGAGYEHPIFDGSFGISSAPDEPAYYRGAWFWRPGTDDITAPVVRANVSGTLGTQDWYRSDVSVSWDGLGPGLAGRASTAHRRPSRLTRRARPSRARRRPAAARRPSRRRSSATPWRRSSRAARPRRRSRPTRSAAFR